MQIGDADILFPSKLQLQMIKEKVKNHFHCIWNSLGKMHWPPSLWKKDLKVSTL